MSVKALYKPSPLDFFLKLLSICSFFVHEGDVRDSGSLPLTFGVEKLGDVP